MKSRLLKKLRRKFTFYSFKVINNTQYIIKNKKGDCRYFPSLRSAIENACVNLGHGELIFNNSNKKKKKVHQVCPVIATKMVKV